MLLNTSRLRCRNPRCRQELPEPADNDRRAFCCRGCRDSFYLRRCLVCEKQLTDPKLKVCGKRCKQEYRRFPHLYQQSKGVGTGAVNVRSKVPAPQPLKRPTAAGDLDALARARRANVAFYKAAGAGAIFQRHTPPLNVIGGYRFPDAPAVDLGRASEVVITSRSLPDSSDPLEIPPFLRRRP